MNSILKLILSLSIAMNLFQCNSSSFKKHISNYNTIRYKTQESLFFPPRYIKLNEFSNDTIWIFPNDYILIRNWEKLDYDTIVCIDTIYSIKGKLLFDKS